MLCNHGKTPQCLLLLITLLVGLLAACGGDEPAPAPPPPPPPPRPVFMPEDVPIELGTSGETVTLQTTEAGGYTRNGEAFASGTTVEATGNTYRLTLAEGEWKAEYVAPRPWATALGTSGDALLITRREDGLYEAGDAVFSSGGTVTAANGNQYRLTLVDNTWQVEYLPPEPTAVLLGMSGETVLVERLEGEGYSVGGQRVVDGSTVQSASGNTYRMAMQDGTWTATFVPPPPLVVSLGASGQTLALQVREDGNYEKNGQLYPSGSTETVGERTYRLVLQNGMWTAMFEAPPPVTVSLGSSGQTVTLLRREDGLYERNGQVFASGTTVEADGETYQLTLQDGLWTAISQAPVLQMVALGTSDVTLTLRRSPDGSWSENGEQVRNGDVRRVGDNRYRLLLDDGEWNAPFLRDSIPVEGAGGLIVLFREEDGTLTYNGETVRDGSIITQDGRTYELVQLSDGWIAAPGTPPPAAGDQNVTLPGSGRTITLTRTDDGGYTYDNAAVTEGRVIRVSGVDYRLTANSQGVWSAAAVTAGPVNPGTVGGPTQTDEVDTFTEGRFGTADDNPYGVRFRRRGRSDVTNRGTSMIPASINADEAQYPTVAGERPADLPDFPVYSLVGRGLVSQERTYAETAKAKLEEIISVIQLNKPLYAAEDEDPDDHIGSDGDDGLWDDAENAVARIFGQTKIANPLGGNPAGSRVDVDEVDAIIAALQDAVSSLSDVGAFEQEFDDVIADKNSDDSTDLDAEDFFTGVTSKIRFGSTNGTRFGVYAVRKKYDGGDPNSDLQHAAQSGSAIEWDTGVIAYTPLDAPEANDIPSRGQAKYQGDTVAIDTTDVDSPVLYAGKIELVASFAKGEVSGTVTGLKDESGAAREHQSDFSARDEVVKSITLPKASRVEADQHGFYEPAASPTPTATLAFERNLPNMTETSNVEFEVQLLDEATEALGAWAAFDLIGSFGATRSGSVATPTLPTFTDRGDGVEDNSRVVYIGTTSSPGALTTEDEDNTFTLNRDNLGAPPGDLGANDAANNLVYELTSLYSRTSTTLRGQTFKDKARSAISRWSSELRKSGDIDADINTTLQTAVEAALNQIGSGFVLSWETDEADLISQLGDLHTALGSRSRFKQARESDGIWSGLSYTDDQIDTILAARNLDFALRMDRTRYTRFGVWSQKAPDVATDSVSDADEIDTGTLAYSFLDREAGSGLSFTADYRGTTVAVDEDTGNLYRGTIDLIVNWNDNGDGGGALTSSITDLRGVSGTSSYFQHDDKDVRTIFFSGITVETTGAFAATNAAVDIGYRDGRQNAGVSNAGNFEGVFVGDSHDEGPLGVLGRWRIAETINFQGSFGADLQP